jgi:hypothetical protein
MERVDFFLTTDADRKTIHNCVIGNLVGAMTNKRRREIIKGLLEALCTARNLKEEGIGYTIIQLKK